jgi:cytochrome c-type biogenesis protein CcmH
MWLVLALLTLLAVSFVIYPLIRTGPKPISDEVYGAEGVVQRANVVLFKEQLADFERQLFDGDIDNAQYAELVAEQKRLLLVDASELIEGEDDSTQEKVPTSPSDSATGVVEKGKPDRGAWLIMASLLLVPLLAFSLYQMLGASDDVDIAELLQRHSSASISTEDYASIGKKIQRKISRRLESKPGDVFYRVTLARLQMEDNNFLAAKKSYEQALTWSPDNAELMAEYAQVLYFVADSKFEGESGAVLDKALSMDPNNRTALGLQGIRAFGDENYALAIKSWQTALRAINPASQQAQALQSGILRAKKLLGDNVSDNNASGEKLPSLLIKVSLSQELKASPDQSVYVFAREWQGKPMPLAVVKLSVADLPASVILDDSMAMPGGESLSSASSIQVVARVSSTGSAIPSEGDYEGLTGKVAASALSDGKTQEIPVLIDRKL